MHARLGRTAETVAALKTALIGARAETSSADFEIARHLEEWGMLDEAVKFAERGSKLPGSQMTDYARIMLRARRMEEGISQLRGGRESFVSQVAGQAVAGLYTPEEKVRLEQVLVAAAARMNGTQRNETLLPFAEAAGLAGLASKWRLESMMAGGDVDSAFVTLESQRGNFGELGRQLEAYASQNTGQEASGRALLYAAQAYIAEGDIESQLRVTRKLLEAHGLTGALLDRFLALLAARRPAELLEIVRGDPSPEIRNRAVQFAIASDKPQLAFEAVRARGGDLPPVWSKAYTALTGVYFDDRSTSTRAAFSDALDARTIAARVTTPADLRQVVAGPVWFYYAARYGEYLSRARDAATDDYLPASIEGSPGFPDAYLALGDFLAETGQAARATTEYEAVLQLDPDRGDAHGRIARLLWTAGRRAEAIARWKSALAAFLRVESRGVRVPESFWGEVSEVLLDTGERRAFGEVRPDVERLLADYIHRKDAYRLSELLQPAARASIMSGIGTAWLVELGRTAGSPDTVLDALINVPDLIEAQRIAVQRDKVALVARQVESSHGYERDYHARRALQFRLDLVSMLLGSGDVKAASAEWGLLATETAEKSQRMGNRYSEVEIQVAAAAGTLDRLLERYRARPAEAPPAPTLRSAALALREGKDEDGARSVLEFLYERELQNGELEAANFLGLAGVKLERKDAPAAVALLSRMALVTEDGFGTLLAAADLLEKHGEAAEAQAFMEKRVKAVPWDAEAKLRLARSCSGAVREELLKRVIGDSQAAYETRAAAARLAGPRLSSGAVGTELDLLASGRVTPESAAKPYYVEARIDVARATAEPGAAFRLWQEALAIAPSNDRVQAGALRAALVARRDSIALALAQTLTPARNLYGYSGGHEYERWRQSTPVLRLQQAQLPDADKVSLAESLSAAAERLDDLTVAQQYLRIAADLRPAQQRDPLERKLKSLAAEEHRRSENAVRQPVVKDVIEQGRVVRPRLVGRAQ